MTQLISLAEWRETRRSVIFMHGLGGHPYDTWRHSDTSGALWPVWLAEDIVGTNVYTLTYPAPASNWLGTTMSLQDRAQNVLASLLTHAKLFDCPTIFICHSLGGLVFKQVCREAKDRSDAGRPEAAKFLASLAQVIFISTPHTGSLQADLLVRWAFLAWPSAASQGLVSNDPNLRSLNRWYRNWSRLIKIQHQTFAETKSTVFWRIVRENEGDPGLIDDDPIPIDADHITISKPVNRKALLYARIKEFISAAAEQDHHKQDKVSQHALLSGRAEDLTLMPLGEIQRQQYSFAPQVLRLGVAAVVLGFACLFAYKKLGTWRKFLDRIMDPSISSITAQFVAVFRVEAFLGARVETHQIDCHFSVSEFRENLIEFNAVKKVPTHMAPYCD